jgi:hypothetical protein
MRICSIAAAEHDQQLLVLEICVEEFLYLLVRSTEVGSWEANHFKTYQGACSTHCDIVLAIYARRE